MNITKRENRSGDKIVFYYDFGRSEGQRHSTGIFIYKNPKDQIQKNHNKEALTLIGLPMVLTSISITALKYFLQPFHLVVSLFAALELLKNYHIHYARLI